MPIFLFFPFIPLLFSVIFALDNPPQLECLENAIRLHFVPDPQMDPPETFAGHVYLKGFFFSAHCHLDYSRQPIGQPFYMHIPYRSECQVKRERSSGGPKNGGENGQNGEQANGVMYSTVVIVQHHRLFVTNRDKAYSITCFYRDAQREFERQFEVGDLTPSDVAGQRAAPTCQYQVLRENAPEGEEAVRFANIGEMLVHKWSCDTEQMGMLVHSCTVRDGLGHSFGLLDERGCVTDPSLMPQLSYSAQLNSSSAPISAFKFADQMVVYFRCQITLCDKSENGCEGITPPICQLIPLPSEGGPPMGVSRDFGANRRNGHSSMPIPRHRSRNPQKCCQNVWGKPQPLPTLFGQGKWEGGRRKRNSTREGAKKHPKLITVDVVADGLIVFARDEGPSLEEKNRLMAQNAKAQQCPSNASFQPFWALSVFALLPIFIAALLIQRHLLQRRINALGTFSPSFPVEMSGFPSAFGQSPVPKPRQYGRL